MRYHHIGKAVCPHCGFKSPEYDYAGFDVDTDKMTIKVKDKTGQYQFYGEFLQPVGMGALQIAFEQMKEKLAAEGLFDADFKRIVKGFMIESFLVEGSQKHDEVFGKSITDPCLGWEDTERLLLDLAEQV